MRTIKCHSRNTKRLGHTHTWERNKATYLSTRPRTNINKSTHRCAEALTRWYTSARPINAVSGRQSSDHTHAAKPQRRNYRTSRRNSFTSRAATNAAVNQRRARAVGHAPSRTGHVPARRFFVWRETKAAKLLALTWNQHEAVEIRAADVLLIYT